MSTTLTVEEIYDFKPQVASWAKKYVRDYADIQDITQTTLTRAWTYRDHFTGGSLKSWIYTIMRSQAINHLRQSKKHHYIEITEKIQDAGGWAMSAEDMFLSSVADTKLIDAIQHVPEPQWKVLRLFEVDRYTVVEISQIMSIPIGTVVSRLYRARRHLREAYLDS